MHIHLFREKKLCKFEFIGLPISLPGGRVEATRHFCCRCSGSMYFWLFSRLWQCIFLQKRNSDLPPRNAKRPSSRIAVLLEMLKYAVILEHGNSRLAWTMHPIWLPRLRRLSQRRLNVRTRLSKKAPTAWNRITGNSSAGPIPRITSPLNVSS